MVTETSTIPMEYAKDTGLYDAISVIVCIFGVVTCSLALFTIRISPALKTSFGTLCTWQMIADLIQLVFTTVYCLLGDWAPPSNHIVSIVCCQTVETLYFFSGELHVLMAVHRFICILKPGYTKKWENAMPIVLFVCTFSSILRILLMTILDTGMYWVYDRKTALWYITETPWTHFFEMYLELGWSILELISILGLDSITLRAIIKWRSKVGHERVSEQHRSIEKRLVCQSLFQCVPTAMVTILYFLVFPVIASQFVKFMCSSFILLFGNVLDASIILLFHFHLRLIIPNQVSPHGFTSTLPHKRTDSNYGAAVVNAAIV